MSCFGIKSTLLPTPIRWVVDFDDYDEDENDDFDDWMTEQAEEIDRLIADNPQAAFVVDFDIVENDFDREFYRQYLDGVLPGSHHFSQAFFVFGNLEHSYKTDVPDAMAALYYKHNHDIDSDEVMRFVHNREQTSFSVNYSVSERGAAKGHMADVLHYPAAQLLDENDLVVAVADSYHDGKYVINGYTGYIHWPETDEDY